MTRASPPTNASNAELEWASQLQLEGVVAYLRDGEPYVVYGSNLGSELDPAWCLNLDAHPEANVEVEGRRLRVAARRAEGKEAERLCALYAQRLPVEKRFRAIAQR